MSNPNINALSVATRNRTFNGGQNPGVKVVHIGKDMQPVSLMTMASINKQPWEKSASFEGLRRTVYSLVDTHSVADVITLVSEELPHNTGAAFQESAATAKSMMDSILNIAHFEPIAFLTSTNKVVKISNPDDLDQRPDDISFLRFRCIADGTAIDNRVARADVLNFQFCLRLPQHIYDVKGETYKAVAPTTHSYGSTAGSLNTAFNSVATTPGTPSTTGTHISPSTPIAPSTTGSFTSPTMKLFISNVVDPSASKKGYYGPLNFLDNQEEFYNTFGQKPQILPPVPSSKDTDTVQKVIRDISDKCRLDIFMHLCMMDYVGEATVDPSLNVQEVCRKISSLKLNYIHNNKQVTDTPDELFNKFSSLSVNLPNDAKTWPIQLCSVYLSALSSEISEEMTSDPTFNIPDLTTLTTKSSQLDALRSVRTCAVKVFKQMKKQDEKMSRLFRNMQSPHLHRNQHSLHHITSNNSVGVDPVPGLSYFQQHQSLAEGTLTKYKGAPNDAQKVQVKTKLHPETCQQHPYTESPYYLSDYPVGFRGCFNCGKTDHWRTANCPLKQAGIFDKTRFFNELWAHKPHTKKSDLSVKPAQTMVLGANQSNREDNDVHRSQILTSTLNLNNAQHRTLDIPYPNLQTLAQTNDNNKISTSINPNFNTMHHPVTSSVPNMQLHNMTSQNRPLVNNLLPHLNPHHPNLPIGNNGRMPHDLLSNPSTAYESRDFVQNTNSPHANDGHYGPRNVDNTPSWMKQKNVTSVNNNTNNVKEDSSSKKQRLWIVSGSLLNTNGQSELRHMPLSLDNGLPAAVLRFGTNDANEIPFSCHLDSCAAMNTGNLLLHKWIITKYPKIVHSYEEYCDNNPFQPIALDCAVPVSKSDTTSNKLTAVVRYKTRYTDPEGNNLMIAFGLGESVSVNAIIGLPIFKKWKLILDVDAARVTSKLLDVYFNLTFQHAASGFPPGISFRPADFFIPARENNVGLTLLSRIASATTTEVKTTVPQDRYNIVQNAYDSRVTLTDVE